MIDIKHAVTIARATAMELFTDEPLPNLALEEIEFDEEKHHWLITLGFDAPHRIKRKTTGPSLFPTIEEEPQRKYKRFRIDAATGSLIAINIPDL